MDAVARSRANDLLSALADGERAAFRPLFDLLWPVLRSFCRKALGDDGYAEDAAQQAILRLFAQASEFDRRRDAVAWALTIAAWQCRTIRRRQSRRREVELPADDASGVASTDDVERAQLEAAAVGILGDMPPRDVRVILAAFTGEPTLRDGAPATFRKRLQRALGRLRIAWRSRHGTL